MKPAESTPVKIRAIIAGSREVTDYRVVEVAVRESGWADDIAVVVSGGARGVDRLGERWADGHLRPVALFLPDYDRHERHFAPIARNREMAKSADLLIAIWDGESRGTKNMIFEARDVGIPVHVHRVTL